MITRRINWWPIYYEIRYDNSVFNFINVIINIINVSDAECVFSKKKKKKYTFISTYNTCTYIDVCMQLRHIVSLFMILITDENDILFKCNTCSLFMITRIYYKLLNVISYYFQQFFIMHKCKYLTNSWNSIDAFIYSSLIAITVY